MGTGVAELAMLASLSDDEVSRIYARYAKAFKESKMDLPSLRQAVARTRRNGFAEMADTVTEGATGIGRALLYHGRPFAAVIIVTVTVRMNENRRQQLVRLLADELKTLIRT
jgi:DNA-binding IclR family transcriptional regulator